MKLSPRITTLALLTALSLPASPALAVYTQPASTFSAGGGVSNSAGYENLGVIGQPGIVGSSSSAGYTANHGFLSVLGDGFKILYPVIAATPGTLTFSLMAGTVSSGQPVGISNTGGSTLNWTVTKASTDSIFGFSPATGSNSGSVTVTATAAGLTPGKYQNTLNISGAGIDQTAQILLDLDVTPSSYTLAVTLKLVTPGKGGGNVSSISTPGISCLRTGGVTDITCQADFPAGSTVTLRQTPNSKDTTWATWGAPGCGTNQDCQIVLNSSQGTDATFPYSFMAKVKSSGNGYDSLVSAYGFSEITDSIITREDTFTEGTRGSVVNFGSGKTINLLGGLDAYYQPTGGFTTIQNALKVGGTNSRLNVRGGIKVKP